MVTVAPPSRAAIQLLIAYPIARRVLIEEGSLDIGRLLISLQRGTTESRYGNVVFEYRYAFIGATDAEMCQLYEHLLHCVEQELGPLVCEPARGMKGNCALPWGYAGLAWGARSRSASSLQTDKMWERRVRALAAGHPDQSYRQEGKVPMTTWRRATFEAANDG